MKKYVSKKQELKSKILTEGEHLVVIEAIEEDEPSKKDEMPWSDITPQLKITLKNEEGVITKWINQKGFKNITDFPDGRAPKGFEFMSSEGNDEQYLVNSKTKARVESEERTEQAINGLLFLAEKAGIPEGQGFDEEDLLGRKVGIKVRDNNGFNEVHYFMHADEVESVEVDA